MTYLFFLVQFALLCELWFWRVVVCGAVWESVEPGGWTAKRQPRAVPYVTIGRRFTDNCNNAAVGQHGCVIRSTDGSMFGGAMEVDEWCSNGQVDGGGGRDGRQVRSELLSRFRGLGCIYCVTLEAEHHAGVVIAFSDSALWLLSLQVEKVMVSALFSSRRKRWYWTVHLADRL